MDGRLGRWLTTDPAGQYASPYLGMGNNPISSVDSDGALANPIYGSDGQYRGTDENGMMGEAIIYDGAFQEGMAQKQIFKNGGLFATEFFIQNNFTCGEVLDFNNVAEASLMAAYFSGIMSEENVTMALGLGIGGFGGRSSRSVIKNYIYGGTQGAKTSTTSIRLVGQVMESVDDVMLNPNLLKGKTYAQVRSILNGSKGWVDDVMNKTRSADKGWVYKQVTSRGHPTGLRIQYHPGSRRHFGGNPYWKVSNGSTVTRVPAGF